VGSISDIRFTSKDIDLEPSLKVAIIGRPNVGKSSLLNSIVGNERSIVSELSGTTRDAVDVEFMSSNGQPFTLVDTAGIRKRASIKSLNDGAEELSVKRSIKAIQQADVVVLVVDVNDGVTVQDFRLSEKISNEGTACVIAVNKCDLIPKKLPSILFEKERNIIAHLRPIDWANVVFISAKLGQKIKNLIQAITAAGVEHRRRISTSTINLILSETSNFTWPKTHSSRSISCKIHFGTQVAVRPPTFVLFVNNPKLFTHDLRKFIENQIRKQIGYKSTPIRIFWRGKCN